jgi:hypothetical protein
LVVFIPGVPKHYQRERENAQDDQASIIHERPTLKDKGTGSTLGIPELVAHRSSEYAKERDY